MHRLHVLLIALALALTPSVGFSQAYPNKPVKVIVTFPPGGTPDIYGRVLSQELSNLWKQAVVVENKAGASGTIGTDFVAKATPDGYTLLFAADASITIAPLLYSKNPYDPVRDLAPIVNAAAGPGAGAAAAHRLDVRLWLARHVHHHGRHRHPDRHRLVCHLSRPSRCAADAGRNRLSG